MTRRVVDVVTTGAVIGAFALTLVVRGRLDLSWWVRGGGLLLAAAGLLLIVLGVRALGPAVGGAGPTRLVTSGIFALMRHPIYLGGAVLLLGLGCALESAAGLVATAVGAWPAFWWSARDEEQQLSAAFGEEYEAYRRRTRF